MRAREEHKGTETVSDSSPESRCYVNFILDSVEKPLRWGIIPVCCFLPVIVILLVIVITRGIDYDYEHD